MTRLRTRRLVGRPAEAADWPLILAILSDPASGRWLSAPGLEMGEGRARKVAARFAESWSADGFGPYVWRYGAQDVGYAGLRRASLEERPVTEALWAMRPAFWGRGFAGEGAAAAIEADADEPVILSWTRPGNAASIRVMEKLGFVACGETLRAGLEHVLYRLERA